MVYFRYFLFVFLFSMSLCVSSQTTDWVKSFGGAESDKGISIGVDSLGFIYVSGYFNTSADFGSINLTSNAAPIKPEAPVTNIVFILKSY